MDTWLYRRGGYGGFPADTAGRDERISPYKWSDRAGGDVDPAGGTGTWMGAAGWNRTGDRAVDQT